MGLLQRAVELHDWSLLALVLMGNHVHLLVDTTTRDLSDGLWTLNKPYAEYYKRQNPSHRGRVFGGRPRTEPIGDDRYLLAVVRYIARNPVAAGLTRRAEDYRWGSYRAIIGAAPALPIVARSELLAWFGQVDPLRELQALVDGADPKHHRAVERWASGPPTDRPSLKSLVAHGDPASFRIAHELWEYSMRAIGRETGMGYSAIRRAILRESLDQVQ